METVMELQSYANKIDKALRSRINDLKDKQRILLEKREEFYRIYREIDKGDRSENAPLEKAIEDIKTNNSNMISNSASLRKLQAIPDLSSYNSVGMVLMYSTVQLECEGSTYIFRIYPKGISFIDICSERDNQGKITKHVGAIAANSRLASALMRKRVGDVVNIKHTSRNSMLSYKICDIY